MIEQTERKSNELNNEINEKVIIEQNYNYYLEFCKLKKANKILKAELISLTKEKKTLKNSINKIESKKPADQKILIKDKYTIRKRHRRTKEEIKRPFECKYENCSKSYGSEGSLNQHFKLKHKNEKV